MPNNRRRLVGRVVSDKMDKTVVVAVETTKRHRLYSKVMRTVKKYYAHDESNTIPVGSMVRIVESRPLSKRKRWLVEDVVTRVTQAAAEAAASEAQAPEAQQEAAAVIGMSEEPEETETLDEAAATSEQPEATDETDETQVDEE